MDWRKNIFRETAVVAAGQVICVAVMIAIFAAFGRFNMTVLLGGILGGLLAFGNHLLLAVFANMAADKAEQQDVEGGKKLLQLGKIWRMAGLVVLLVAFAKSGWCNLLALVLPLAFTGPILIGYELITKRGGKNR